MPELPEVETLKRQLVVIKNKIIKSAEVKWPKMVKPLSVLDFQKKIKNQKILGVSRRAKVLILKLSSGDFLTIHLKLTGQLIYKPYAISHKLIVGGHPQEGGTENLPNKFTHIILDFSDGGKLYFNDMRKFGWMRLMTKEEVEKMKGDYGIEPLTAGFTLKKFTEAIKKYSNRKIKQILLDQTLIAGIGNIYADESCFCAGILPMKLAKKLSDSEIKKLFVCIQKVIKFSISKKGTSDNTYVQLNGQPGGFVPFLNVYRRKGEVCRGKKCCGKIERTVVAGRGTHYCPACQK